METRGIGEDIFARLDVVANGPRHLDRPIVPQRIAGRGEFVGAQIDLNRNVALRADWQSYPSMGGSTLPKTDVNLISAGALWRFR